MEVNLKLTLSLLIGFVVSCMPPEGDLAGFRVHTNNHSDIDNNKIESVTSKVEQLFNTKFSDNLDLRSDILEEHNVNVYYLSQLTSGDNYQGETWWVGSYTNIEIIYKDEQDNPTDQYLACMNNYGVLGHEMLHAIAMSHMSVNVEDNFHHKVGGLFGEDSVDTELYAEMQTWCKE